MTLSKRSFLRLAAAQGCALALVACGGDDTPAAGAGAGAGGVIGGSLTLTGTSNLPDAATAFTPDAGVPAGSSSATVRNNLLNVAVSSLVNGSTLRVLSAPLSGTAPPAVGSTYNIVVDGNSNGSPLTLIVSQVLTSRNYAFASESGVVKITALSATSADLLFTNVTLHADTTASNNSATGNVILNGTITVKRL